MEKSGQTTLGQTTGWTYCAFLVCHPWNHRVLSLKTENHPDANFVVTDSIAVCAGSTSWRQMCLAPRHLSVFNVPSVIISLSVSIYHIKTYIVCITYISYKNLQYHQWRQSWYHSNFRFLCRIVVTDYQDFMCSSRILGLSCMKPKHSIWGFVCVKSRCPWNIDK